MEYFHETEKERDFFIIVFKISTNDRKTVMYTKMKRKKYNMSSLIHIFFLICNQYSNVTDPHALL